MKDSETKSQERIHESTWITLAILGSTILITMYGETMLLPAISDIIRDFDISYSTSSWILTAYLISGAVMTPIAGKLSDKIESRFVASVGMGLSMMGLFLLVFLTPDTTNLVIIINLLILGTGFALFSSPNVNAIMNSVEKKFLGVASGTQATMRAVGQMFSMGIAMMLFSIYIGRVEINPSNFPQFLSSVKMAFLVFSILCFGGIFASIARGKTTSRSHSG